MNSKETKTIRILALLDIADYVPDEVDKFLDKIIVDTVMVTEEPTRVLIDNDSIEIL